MKEEEEPGLMPRDYPRIANRIGAKSICVPPTHHFTRRFLRMPLASEKGRAINSPHSAGKACRRYTDTRNRAAGCRFCRVTTHITVQSLTPRTEYLHSLYPPHLYIWSALFSFLNSLKKGFCRSWTAFHTAL